MRLGIFEPQRFRHALGWGFSSDSHVVVGHDLFANGIRAQLVVKEAGDESQSSESQCDEACDKHGETQA